MRYGFSSEKIKDLKYPELADLKTAVWLRTSVWWHFSCLSLITLKRFLKKILPLNRILFCDFRIIIFRKGSFSTFPDTRENT
jgi:hypothetical protein